MILDSMVERGMGDGREEKKGWGMITKTTMWAGILAPVERWWAWRGMACTASMPHQCAFTDPGSVLRGTESHTHPIHRAFTAGALIECRCDVCTKRFVGSQNNNLASSNSADDATGASAENSSSTAALAAGRRGVESRQREDALQYCSEKH